MPPDAERREVVSVRTLSAECVAAACTAVLQHPAVWEAVTVAALLIELVDRHRRGEQFKLGQLVVELVDGLGMTNPDVDAARHLLEAADAAARAWTTLAFPVAAVPTEITLAGPVPPRPGAPANDADQVR